MTVLQREHERRWQRAEALRLEVLSATITALERLLPETPVYIYGSVIRPGRFHADSDVDLALTSEPKDMSVYRLQAKFEEAIGRPVDLCILDETRFAEVIMREGMLWTK
jgi:predicted nucleotidyltransferase